MRHAPAATRRRFRSRETLIVLFQKYITVAALLAAGAALSNAAIKTELLWGLDFTSSSLGLSTGTGTSVSGDSTKINTTGGAVAGTGSYSTGGSGDATKVLRFTATDDTSVLYKQTGAFTLSFHAKWDGDSNNRWPVLASFGENSTWCAKVNFSNKEDASQAINSSGSYGFAPDNYGFVDNTRGDEVTLDNSWHHFVVTFQGSGNARGTATLTLYVDGTSTATTNWTGNGVDNNNPMANFSFGGRLGSDNASNTANMSFSDIAVYKGVLEADQIAYLGSNKANASAIPEPSAFGLLAGLGALALVASRRRRK